MFDVALIDGDIEFSMKAFRNLKVRRISLTNLWSRQVNGVLFHSVKEHTVLVRREQNGSVEEMTHAEWLNT